MRIPAYLFGLLASLVLLAVPSALEDTARGAAAIVCVALLAGVTCAVLPRMVALGAWTWTSVILALAAGAGIVAVALAPERSALQWWPLAPAGAVLALFVLQLLRGADAERKIDSLAGGVAVALCVTSAAGWVAVLRDHLGTPGSDHGLRWSVILVSAVGLVLAVGVSLLLARGTAARRNGHAAVPGQDASMPRQDPSVPGQDLSVPAQDLSRSGQEAAAPDGRLRGMAVALSAVCAAGAPVALVCRVVTDLVH